ncbi:MAG: AraC family transcriptional regulator [Clostridiales bacterium]|nr:AraC family transcriptional regulator [Clostridiales bacterium]
MLKTDNNYFAYENIGEFHSDDEWIHPTRVISSYELIFVLSGTVYLFEDDKRYELHTNECILLEPGKQHGGYHISNGLTSFYWLHFRTDCAMPFKTFVDADFYDLKYLLKKLLHMSRTPVYNTDALDAASFLIFSELQNLTSFKSGNSFANKVAEYIRIKIDKNVSVSAVAKHFGYSPDYISKLFKKVFGVGMKEYISAERMKYAKDLLLTTNLSVKEISAQTGFADENHFIKFFNYHEGKSPLQFRNMYFNIKMNDK